MSNAASPGPICWHHPSKSPCAGQWSGNCKKSGSTLLDACAATCCAASADCTTCAACILTSFASAAIGPNLTNCHLYNLSLIHISEPTRQAEISYAVFCLKKKKKKT